MSVALPIPAGWYALGPAAEISTDTVREQRFCGRVLTVRRDRGGVRATDAGRSIPVVERGGMVLAWFHPDGDAPTWRPEPLDEAGWTPMTFTRQVLPVHPLHVMRDLADVVHFTTVHRYKDIDLRLPLTARGPRLDTAVGFGWDTGLPGVQRGLPASFESSVEGPGFQRTEVLVPMGQWISRHLVLPTPLGDGTSEVHLGVSIRLTGGLGRLEQRIGARALYPLRTAIHGFLARMFARDIGRDAAMWVTLPHELDDRAPEDEHFAVFRDWQEQFLPQRTTALRRAASAAL